MSTCRDVSVANLGDVGSNFDHAAPYAPSHPTFLLDLIRRLDIEYPRYDFVDLGSGKGRGQRCKNISLIHGDAMQYVFEKVPTVVFMFNPFRPAVLAPVLAISVRPSKSSRETCS